MPILPWRAKQSTSTTGTGTLTLDAAPAAARSLNAAFGGSSIVIRYAISWASGYEMGIGTFDGGSPGTLTRSIVFASSNSGALVSLPAGVKDVFAWIDPGERRLIESTATTVNITPEHLGNFLYWTGTSAGTVNLAAIANVPLGSDIEIRNDGAALLTVDANGSETINGFTTLTLAVGEAATLRRVTAGWVSSALPAEAFIRTQVASGVAAVDFTLPAGFSSYRLEWSGVRPATDGAALILRTSTDGGSSFAAGAADYTDTLMSPNPGGGTVSSATGTSAGMRLTVPLDTGNAAGTSAGTAFIWRGDGTREPTIRTVSDGLDNSTSSLGFQMSKSNRSNGAEINAIRVLTTSGNISSGRFTLMGIR